MEVKRQERETLHRDACARRLQGKYRSRLAARRVERLRAERRALQEEGCAIKLQVTALHTDIVPV